MKRITYKQDFVESTVDEIVDELFDGDWDPNDWEYTIDVFDDSLSSEHYYDVTEEEKEEILKAAKERFDKKVKDAREQEIEDWFSYREDIVDLIRDTICHDAEFIGDAGFLLSPEEIVDLIIKNGNK